MGNKELTLVDYKEEIEDWLILLRDKEGLNLLDLEIWGNDLKTGLENFGDDPAKNKLANIVDRGLKVLEADLRKIELPEEPPIELDDPKPEDFGVKSSKPKYRKSEYKDFLGLMDLKSLEQFHKDVEESGKFLATYDPDDLETLMKNKDKIGVKHGEINKQRLMKFLNAKDISPSAKLHMFSLYYADIIMAKGNELFLSNDQKKHLKLANECHELYIIGQNIKKQESDLNPKHKEKETLDSILKSLKEKHGWCTELIRDYNTKLAKGKKQESKNNKILEERERSSKEGLNLLVELAAATVVPIFGLSALNIITTAQYGLAAPNALMGVPLFFPFLALVAIFEAQVSIKWWVWEKKRNKN
ncbi:MAG: hypothetical protein JXA43_02065 [Candidatus Diapherotrites archaeon]|nr:hypothetical protein [Candidatus Diapherotrites archaeon]